MRASAIVLVGLLALSSLTLVAPPASAVGYCTAATGHCQGWIVCVGESTNQWGGISCQYGIRQPCDPTYCDPWWGL